MSHASDEQHRWAASIARGTFLALTALLFCTAIYLIRAELNAIILGILLAGVLMPLHRRVVRLMERCDGFLRKKFFHTKLPKEPGRRKLLEVKIQTQIRRRAAMLSVALVFLIIVIPVGTFVVQLAKQGVATLRSTAIWLEQELPNQVPKAIDLINHHEIARKVFLDLQLFTLPELPESQESQESQESLEAQAAQESLESQEPQEAQAAQESLESLESLEAPDDAPELPVVDAQQVTGFLVNTSRNLFSGALKLLGKVLSKTWLTVFNFFLMLFVMFFVFYDGQNIMKYARDSIPLGAEEQQQVLQRIKEVSSSIAFSIFGTALCQAIVAMIIFRIVGIPALFWGSMLGMCSIIPFVGTSLIWVPATLYLFATGQIWQACVMLAGGLLVANIDNVLRPFLMKKGGKTGMSYLVLFFAILGGLQTFGLVGVIYGPLIFGICGICLLLFSTQFKKEHINQ